MRRFALVVFLSSLAAPAAAQQPGQSYTARVTAVTDADTYDVRTSEGTAFTVRLWGVDAPESSQPYGLRATRIARRYVQDTNVRVVIEDIGRYGRAIASVEVQGGSLGQMLVRRGMAWHYDEYAPNASELARLKRQARNANRGLWSQPRPIPPWEWRDRSSGEVADKDCSDFSTHSAAQSFFERHQPGDPHNLDGDAETCESPQKFLINRLLGSSEESSMQSAGDGHAVYSLNSVMSLSVICSSHNAHFIT